MKRLFICISLLILAFAGCENKNVKESQQAEAKESQQAEAEAADKADENGVDTQGAGSWKIQMQGKVPASDAQQIARLLNRWNDAMNQHDANAVANTHTDNAMIRGKVYTVAAYRDKEAKAFDKHPDFQQSPASDVYATPLPDKNGYHLIFDETFSQGGKDTPTEIMLVVIRQNGDYKISYESDISTDRELIKKMGVSVSTSPNSCTQLGQQILVESPLFRYQYIPMFPELSKSKTLSVVCEDESECMFAENEDMRADHIEFDYPSMTMTDPDFGHEYAIHPKYTQHIRNLCH